MKPKVCFRKAKTTPNKKRKINNQIEINWNDKPKQHVIQTKSGFYVLKLFEAVSIDTIEKGRIL